MKIRELLFNIYNFDKNSGLYLRRKPIKRGKETIIPSLSFTPFQFPPIVMTIDLPIFLFL